MKKNEDWNKLVFTNMFATSQIPKLILPIMKAD